MEHPFSERNSGEFQYGAVLAKRNCNGLPSIEKTLMSKYCAALVLMAEIFSGFGHWQVWSKISPMYLVDVWKNWHFSALNWKPYCWIHSETETRSFRSFVLGCICNNDVINECNRSCQHGIHHLLKYGGWWWFDTQKENNCI